MKRILSITLCSLLGAAALALVLAPESAAQKKQRSQPEQAAVERTRKTVRMLDDIYKQTIVLITAKYVTKDSDYPAGRAAVRLFDTISKNGWHGVRLIDATGMPYSTKNVAKDAFEKDGIAKLKAGADYHEQVIERDGKPYLRAITPVPVVMPKCVACHAHYADVKEGAPVGAISYTVPIE